MIARCITLISSAASMDDLAAITCDFRASTSALVGGSPERLELRPTVPNLLAELELRTRMVIN